MGPRNLRRGDKAVICVTYWVSDGERRVWLLMASTDTRRRVLWRPWTWLDGCLTDGPTSNANQGPDQPSGCRLEVCGSRDFRSHPGNRFRPDQRPFSSRIETRRQHSWQDLIDITRRRYLYDSWASCWKLLILAATLRGSRPGVQSASPKTPKNNKFLGVTQPPGVAQPLYSTGHN